MINEHVSEQDIQLAVLDNTLLLPELRQHLDECLVCKARVKEYELLFTGISAQPKPSFDFDVVELVMPVLPEKKRSESKVPVFIAISLLLAGLLGLPLLLFDYRISVFWQTISPWMIGIVAIVVIVLVVMSLADMYTNYRQQLQKLNFE